MYVETGATTAAICTRNAEFDTNSVRKKSSRYAFVEGGHSTGFEYNGVA
jgi:hypothetical protein